MLKRSVSLIFLARITNRRLFSLTTILNRQRQQKNTNDYSIELNNQHRDFGKFQNIKYKKKTNQNSEKEDLDVKKPQFNRYKVTQSYSANKKSLEDDDNDIFSEEKDNLTMLGIDKKTFSSSSTISSSKPTSTAISLDKKTEK